MPTSKRAHGLLASTFLAATMAVATPPSYSETPANDTAKPTGSALTNPELNQASVNDQVKHLLRVMQMISAMHFDKEKSTDVAETIKNAINGMLKELDPHSIYMDKKETDEFREKMSGGFAGIGISFGIKNEKIVIEEVLENSPAEKAGIKAGDVIVKVDDLILGAMKSPEDMDPAVKKMRGDAGTTVKIDFLREGNPISFNITRDIVRNDVVSAVIDGDIGYIKVRQFSSMDCKMENRIKRVCGDKDTFHDFQKAIRKIQAEAGDRLAGYVVNLENDPGGDLETATKMLNLILDGGTITSVKARNPSDSLTYVAEPGDMMKGKKLVVMMNGRSASASEIFAGAVQDNRRGIIVGTQSFGKGSVQIIAPLPYGDSLKVTIAQYYTPSGASIQGRGITPDIEYVPVNEDEKAFYASMPKESKLEHTLAAGGPAADTTNRTTHTCTPTSENPPTAGLDKHLTFSFRGEDRVNASLACAIRILRGSGYEDLVKVEPKPATAAPALVPGS